MRSIKLSIVILVIAALLLPLIALGAVQQNCQAWYMVKRGDTLRQVAMRYNVSPWSIAKANNRLMLKPNYPLFAGVRVCIPKQTNDSKVLPPSVIDASAAEWGAIQRSTKVTVVIVGFPKGSNWLVKMGYGKIGKIRVPGKNAYAFSFNALPGDVICLKNQLTDYLLCTRVIKLK